MGNNDLGKPEILEGDSKVSFMTDIEPSDLKKQLEAQREKEPEKDLEKASVEPVGTTSEPEQDNYITLNELKERISPAPIGKERTDGDGEIKESPASPQEKKGGEPEVMNIPLIPKSKIISKGTRCPKCSSKLKMKDKLIQQEDGLYLSQFVRCSKNRLLFKRCDYYEKILERID